MIKYFSIFFVLFLFTGCSFKIPFISSSSQLEDANKCQEMYLKKEKISCYEKLDDNSYAQLRLGIYYANNKEFKKAVPLLQNSNKNKNPYSNLALAFLYFKGDGVKKDLNKSFVLLSSSSSIDPNAAYQLSRFYFNGIEVKQDTNKGIKLLEFAASKNMSSAKKRLHDIYFLGFKDIKKDEKKAKFWEEKIKEKKEDLTFNIYKL